MVFYGGDRDRSSDRWLVVHPTDRDSNQSAVPASGKSRMDIADRVEFLRAIAVSLPSGLLFGKLAALAARHPLPVYLSLHGRVGVCLNGVGMAGRSLAQQSSGTSPPTEHCHHCDRRAFLPVLAARLSGLTPVIQRFHPANVAAIVDLAKNNAISVGVLSVVETHRPAYFSARTNSARYTGSLLVERVDRSRSVETGNGLLGNQSSC